MLHGGFKPHKHTKSMHHKHTRVFKKKLLTRRQICRCMQDLDEIHPLRSRTNIVQIEPSVGKICRKFCGKKSKPCFRHTLKLCILKDMGLDLPENELEIIKDPFQILGYGPNSFFEILTVLTILFLVITIFSMPLYYFYS